MSQKLLSVLLPAELPGAASGSQRKFSVSNRLPRRIQVPRTRPRPLVRGDLWSESCTDCSPLLEFGVRCRRRT